MRINQVSVAGCLKFFKNNFLKRYSLNDYYDSSQPCFFLGAEQPNIINNHKGLKIIYLASEYDCTFLNQLSSTENTILHWSPYLKNYPQFKNKYVEIELKDYSNFKPNVMGDKIYTYIGWWERKCEFQFDLLNEIQKKIKYEIMYGIVDDLNNYYSVDDLKSNFYDKSFLNINLSSGTGMTTVRELGLMGRKTIINCGYPFPSIIPYNSIDHIIEIINEESLKIGTIGESMDCHTVKDEWLELNFWTNDIS